jgi:hypothetical protein
MSTNNVAPFSFQCVRFRRSENAASFTAVDSFTSRRQSYDFGVYKYNASAAVGQSVFSKEKKIFFFIPKRTRLHVALKIFYNKS